MIKFKRILLYSCIVFVLISNFSYCYGSGISNVKDFPIYFTTETWKKVKHVNAQNANEQNITGIKKVLAVMDSPVEYIGDCLGGKNDKFIQAQVDSEKSAHYRNLENLYHGTSVAGLIASRPCKLKCINDPIGGSSKLCDKEKIGVAGIAQRVKMVNVTSPGTYNDVSKGITGSGLEL